MQLAPEEASEFLRLHGGAILYAALRAGDVPAGTTMAQFYALKMEDKLRSRNRLYEDPQLLRDYLREMKPPPDAEVSRTVEGFANFVRDRFYIVKLYKKYAVFMADDALYGVLGITQPVSDLVHPSALPALVEAVLLPYRGKYVFDGFLLATNVLFGRNMSHSIDEQFKTLKARGGIIESAKDERPADDGFAAAEGELRHILNSRRRWEEQYERISELKERFPALDRVFYASVSKLYARSFKKRLKKLEVRNRHFAVYYDSIVAVAPTRRELNQQLEELSMRGNTDDCTIFKL